MNDRPSFIIILIMVAFVIVLAGAVVMNGRKNSLTGDGEEIEILQAGENEKLTAEQEETSKIVGEISSIKEKDGALYIRIDDDPLSPTFVTSEYLDNYDQIIELKKGDIVEVLYENTVIPNVCQIVSCKDLRNQ